MMRYIADVSDDADLSKTDLKSGAERYLLSGGLSSEEIETLIEKLSADY